MIIPLFKDLKKSLKKTAGSFPKIKVALLGDSSTQFLATAIQGIGIERGFNIDLFEAEYDQVERHFLNQTSELFAFNADYVVVFQSTHKLLCKFNQSSAEKQSSIAIERLKLIELMCKSVTTRLIYLNYPEIDDDVFGSYANKIESSFIYQIRKLNYELMVLSQQRPNLFICDIAALQNKFGRNNMFCSSVYVNTEMVLSIDIVPYVASRIMDIIGAVQGKMKKCLILDLDNILWGGVIGDDGIENIQIGNGLGIGKAFTEFQQWIRKLKDRGIILTVCSKNEEDLAKEPFKKHPDMVLRLDDIAVFIANWKNKVDNIRQIQSILNIGFDSMVFLDDNPFERSMVRENIAGITIPELPEDPGEYLEYLYSLNLFETGSYNITDSDRTKQYQAEAQRSSLQKSFTDEAGFLKSLGMVSEVSSFNHFNAPRAAQLSQRSNQFNLRTIRYTEDDITEISKNRNFRNFIFTLSDKFGEHGIICIVIMELINAETLFINTWLMSCRVLKRNMENFTLNTIIKYARENGFKKLIGEYIPTSKNKIVADHYLSLGFSPIADKDRFLYQLDVGSYKKSECYVAEKL